MIAAKVGLPHDAPDWEGRIAFLLTRHSMKDVQAGVEARGLHRMLCAKQAPLD